MLDPDMPDLLQQGRSVLLNVASVTAQVLSCCLGCGAPWRQMSPFISEGTPSA